MKRLFITLMLGLALFSAFAPSTLAAANFFGPIVPDGTNGQPDCSCAGQTTPGGVEITTAPDWGCVMQTIQNAINLAISLSFIIAILYIVLTGFLFVSSAGNPGQIEAAKKRLMNVVIGILVVLSAWLLVDFVMKTLYNSEGEFGPWNQILASTGDDICFDVSTGAPPVTGLEVELGDGRGGGAGTGTGGAGTDYESGVVNQGHVSHADGLALLQAAGISVASSGNCSDRTNPSCTSLQNIREDSVKQAIAVKQACNCAVTVTGGTEVGHSPGTRSHGNGYKIDLRVNSGLDAYIQSLTRSGARNGDPRYVDRCGNEYVKEGSPAHWDITTSSGVCSPPKR